MEERRDQRNKPQQGQGGLRQQQQQQQGQGSGRQPRQGGQPQQGGQSQQGGQWQNPGQAGQRSRQQQQFDPQGSRQPSGGGESRFAEQIQAHMEVIDDTGAHVGTVDHMEGDRIKLTRESSPDGEHHYLPLSLVAGVEGGRIRLRGRGDTSFGMEADR